jgi:hypothetical protein
MAESVKQKENETDALATSTGPLVFISHDGRDSEFAEALSKLLKSVSAGMIKTFRSSDKKGTEGIDFGDEWYKRLMAKLQSTSDVVCIFTERSLDRPWILFEAGVAKGKLETPVIGLALGVPLSRVATGPFYQFQNMDDSEGDLLKLVHQLARRVPSLELDTDVVKSQISTFKSTEETILKSLSTHSGKKDDKGDSEDNPIAKLGEEIKALPLRIVERMSEDGLPAKRRRIKRYQPMMIEELMHISEETNDPIGILMIASVIKDDLPWLYELATDAYNAIRSGNIETIDHEMIRIRRFSKAIRHGPFLEEFGFADKDTYMFIMEFPSILEHMIIRMIEEKKSHTKKRPTKSNKLVE